MQYIYITLVDYLLLPIYVAIIYMIAYSFRNRKYPPGHPWRAYFIPGLTVKLIGGVFIGLIYQYYYGFGDTASYFYQSTIINSAFAESPVKWIKLLLHIPKWYDSDYQQYIAHLQWYTSSSSYIVSSVTALLGILCFNTFLPCTVLMAALSYTGVWALFRTFATQYPKIVKYVAISLLFIPSVFMWGSGILKDTLCLFALGWLTHIVFNIFIQGRISLRNLLMLFLSLFIIYTAKLYILIAYIPSLILWIMLNYSDKISSKFVKILLQFTIIGVGIIGFIQFNNSFSEELGQYSLERVAATSTTTRDYIYNTSDGGSGYELGDIDPSPFGMLKKMPQAINVSLFRPYLWEARKPIVFLNAIEATIIMLVTLKVIFKVGPRRIWKAISGDANIQFCLIFSLIFAFAVGISSYNFGSLSRYRIPCIPLYVLSLVLIYYKYYPPEKSIFKFR